VAWFAAAFGEAGESLVGMRGGFLPTGELRVKREQVSHPHLILTYRKVILTYL
jgi:hypothetical protein